MVPHTRHPAEIPARIRCAALAILVLSITAGCASEEAPPTVPADGPYFQRMTTTSVAETSPAFSPDGTRLVYERNSEIWVLDVATRSASMAYARGNNPSWSPDGNSLLFVRRDVQGGGPIHRLIRLNLASGVIDTVSADSVDVYEPAASPIGGTVALRILSRVNTVQSLRVIQGDGDDLATLTTAGPWVDTSPAWSPDGVWIAFVRLEDGGTARLMRVPASGGSSPTLIAGATDGASGPTWHPDGSIVYSKAGVLTALPATGGSARTLVTGAGLELEPAISPDGKRLVFATDRTGNFELWQLFDPAGIGPGPYTY